MGLPQTITRAEILGVMLAIATMESMDIWIDNKSVQQNLACIVERDTDEQEVLDWENGDLWCQLVRL